MATGQQDYWNTFYNINYRNQKILMFNKILRLCNMIGGYQRDNRLATIMQAADNDPDFGQTADERTTVINWCMRHDNTYDKISESFDGAVMCGLNLLQIWMDHREDPESGHIRTDRIPFNAFLMDNYWTKQSLEDCDRIWTRRYLSRRQLLSLYPRIEKDLPLFGKGYAAKDGKFQFLAQNWYQYQQEMYAYDEYWTREYRKKRRIIDKATGEILDWNGTKEQFQLLRRFNPNIDLISVQVPTIKLHVLVNQHLIYEEKSPWGLDRFPFVPFLAYHFPEVQNYAYRYQGIVRNIRDSQIELNRRRNRLLDIMDAQIQSGLMVKEDALVNPEDAFFQGPGKVLYFKQSANLASDVAPIPPPPVAQGWMELIQTIEKEIMDIVGPEELFAQNLDAKDMSGILMKLKMGAGLKTLQNLFDRLNTSQKMVGEIFDDLIAKNFSKGKVNQILGHEASPRFFDQTYSKYHITCEEAELTASQRQLQFLQALQLKQIIPDAVSDEYLLEKSTLSGKKDLIERAQKNAQMAQQMQQAATLAEMEQKQVLTRSLEAKAQADFATAEERKSRAVSDIALAKERSSQAIQDRAQAALDNVKALHELEQIPEDRLIKLSNFILEMQERQKALQGQEEGDSVEEASLIGSPVERSEMESKPQNANAMGQ